LRGQRRPRRQHATAIEYGLIAALISVVIIAAVTLVGTQLSAVFNGIAAALATASWRAVFCRADARRKRRGCTTGRSRSRCPRVVSRLLAPMLGELVQEE
jgi:pilus assembly protein Flp/PilA